MEDNELGNQVGSSDAAPLKPRSLAPDYLAAAKAACSSGDDVLGMHLYLAAFEAQSQNGSDPSPEALQALRTAWDLAISLKERSMAEYIFEKIEPFLPAREMGEFADALQQLALDRLEQFGLSREELEGMAGALSDDFFGGPLGEPGIHIEQFTFPAKQPAEEASQSGGALGIDDACDAIASDDAAIDRATSEGALVSGLSATLSDDGEPLDLSAGESPASSGSAGEASAASRQVPGRQTT